MSSLTDTGEDRSLNWLTGNSATAPVLPLKVRLMTTNGSDAAAGTELTGSGYTAGGIAAAFGAAAGGVSANTGALSFGVLDASNAKTITGFEVWDSAGTPVRWWWAPLTGGDKVVNAGDQAEFAAGALTLQQQ